MLVKYADKQNDTILCTNDIDKIRINELNSWNIQDRTEIQEEMHESY